MNRRQFLGGVGLAGAGAGLALAVRSPVATSAPDQTPMSQNPDIPVAFLISRGANVIDLAGAWEVFQDAVAPRSDGRRFRLFTVSDSPDTVIATGGLKIVPDYTVDTAPTPALVSVGAQAGSDRLREWLRAQGETAILMSVCTGAFQLAQTGLLDGRRATTHHDFWDSFQNRFPRVELVRGPRFVQSSDNIYTAGGLTSGIDLALHVVARIFGEQSAENTATYMEYESTGWRTPASGQGLSLNPQMLELSGVSSGDTGSVDRVTGGGLGRVVTAGTLSSRAR